MKSYEALDSIRHPLASKAIRFGYTCSSMVMVSFLKREVEEAHRNGLQIRAELEANGFTVERMFIHEAWENSSKPTLRQFIDAHPTGSYVMVTLTGGCHSMSLRDGVLMDTDMMGTSRRRISVAYEVAA